MDIAAPTPFTGQRPRTSTQASHSPPPDSRQAAATTSRVSLCCTGFCRHRSDLLIPCRPPRPVYHMQASASRLRGHLRGGTLLASIAACMRWLCLVGLRRLLHAPPVPRRPPLLLARTAALHRSDVRASYPAAISFPATTCCLQRRRVVPHHPQQPAATRPDPPGVVCIWTGLRRCRRHIRHQALLPPPSASATSHPRQIRPDSAWIWPPPSPHRIASPGNLARCGRDEAPPPPSLRPQRRGRRRRRRGRRVVAWRCLSCHRGEGDAREEINR